MKVIFLDIDGVLNSEEWAIEKVNGKYRGYGGHFKEKDEITVEDVGWDSRCLDYLYKIVSHTGAKIVISSTWRNFFTIKKFYKMFELYGWPNPPIIDKTLDFGSSSSRGIEINEWLSRNPDVTSYVILDDTSDFLPDQIENFVNTSFVIGLDEIDADDAIQILNRHDK